ncbi:MAG: tripartite tricarboxylate transporter permease [Nanoarchaeota archaeon]|nr:tripartite tricarboxylate transporter permease [Nanoarchaeota archaeon]
MLLELILFLFLGVLAGTLTGLIPGIHINLIGAAIVSGTFAFLSGIEPLFFVTFIVSMSIAHIYIDFIPSIFLGAPEDGTELSVLPGHEMLKNGEGFQAVKLTSVGCFYGIIIFLILIFPLYLISTFLKEIPGMIISIGLIAISANMVLTEKKKARALGVFLLTGILGFIIFNMELNEPLLPLLTGLFGSAGLILSMKQKTSVVRQETLKKEKIKFQNEKNSAIFSAIVSPLSLFLPALSGGQIAIIVNQFVKKDKKGFLFLLGIISMLTMCLSFLGLFLISKTRTGSSAAIKSLVGVPEWNVFILIVIVIFVSGGISFFITGIVSKKFIQFLEKTNYSKTSLTTLILIVLVTLIISGIMGILVLVISTFVGIYSISLGVKRTNMIGCLILPTIIFYMGII